MAKWKELNLYQKGLLLCMALLIAVFTVVYSVTVTRVGYAYKGTILVPGLENDCEVYTGKLQGKAALFTVHPDKTVEFRWGGKTYGPYTALEDVSAIPQNTDLSQLMTGLELRRGEEILFRGGVMYTDGRRMLYNEDGSAEFFITVSSANGTMMDENGHVIDSMEPSVHTLLDLMGTPELTHKGSWAMWLLGVCVCIGAALSVFFADSLFRWRMTLQVRDPYDAEPSDWVLAARYIGWTLSPILAFAVFIMGLQ